MDTCRYFLCFTLFSFIGWAYETVYYSIQQRRFVNSGFLSGCICPIYGFGGLLLGAMLGGVKNPIKLFVAGMVITCILEYFVSWLLEKIFHKRWWDYSNWPLNINGRVCIIAGMAFGIMSVLGVKVIIPEAYKAAVHLSNFSVHIIAAAILLLMLIDLVITVKNSDNFSDKLWYVREQSKIFEENGAGRRLMAAFGGNRLKQFGRLFEKHSSYGLIEEIKKRLKRD